MSGGQELFECSICFELLRDPVTASCGHSYCKRCINDYWDSIKNGIYRCPQCRKTFTERPDLQKNTLLAALMEEHRKNTSQSAASEAGHAYAEPGDVACDACTGRKRKASRSCLVCLTSYCETHLKPHFEVPPLKKHKLTEACERIHERICKRHDKLLEIFCRTDQEFICLQCVMEEHKSHDTVTAAAEQGEIKIRLDWAKQEIADHLLYLEGKNVELKQAAQSITHAAQEACRDFERLCAEHIRFVQRKCSEMKVKFGEARKSGVAETINRLMELQDEQHALRKREDKLDQLTVMTDQPIQFIQGFKALEPIPTFLDFHRKLNTLTEFVSAQKDTIKNLSREAKNDISSQCFEKNEYVKLELDPNTVPLCLCLSDKKDKLAWGGHDQAQPDHPDRFTFYHQALCKNALTGNHYWEVRWDGGIVDLAVSYRDIKRKGSGKESCFGHNKLSWKLTCSPLGCVFWHDGVREDQIHPAPSRRVGIHLDYEAGTLAFYSVFDRYRLTLLHKIQTTFTKPLYPGFSVDLGSSLKICNI